MFDSVGHNFILANLKYFEFGPIMINIARRILSSRVGGIITAEGLTRMASSRIFRVGVLRRILFVASFVCGNFCPPPPVGGGAGCAAGEFF